MLEQGGFSSNTYVSYDGMIFSSLTENYRLCSVLVESNKEKEGKVGKV